jgi:hypothetical protein
MHTPAAAVMSFLNDCHYFELLYDKQAATCTKWLRNGRQRLKRFRRAARRKFARMSNAKQLVSN